MQHAWRQALREVGGNAEVLELHHGGRDDAEGRARFEQLDERAEVLVTELANLLEDERLDVWTDDAFERHGLNRRVEQRIWFAAHAGVAAGHAAFAAAGLAEDQDVRVLCGAALELFPERVRARADDRV